MIKYRFAKREDGQTITAEEIVGKPPEDYTCIGCEREVIGKVNGQIVRPHFAHKVQGECSPETYLHKLGKSVFFKVYKRCLEEGTSFSIRLKIFKTCRQFEPFIMTSCPLREVEKEYDLTNYYQDIRVEQRDGQFIPDIILRSNSYPRDPIYVEIACAHFISQDKRQSGRRIIEIPIESEEDLEKIEKASLTTEEALFVGFNQSTDVITSSECECASKKCYGFFVYASGKSILKLEPLAVFYSKATHGDRVIYKNLFFSGKVEARHSLEDWESGGQLFIREVKLAASRGVPIKNCYLCRYHALNTGSFNGDAIFCKTFRKTCNSNTAANCERYRK